MDGVRQVRRIAVTAAYGGGGLGLFAATLAGVVISQAKLTRRAIRPLGVAPLCPDGVYGPEYGGDPIVLALLGDSSIVGYGVTSVAETPGALLGTGLSRLARRPVRIVSAAAVGATSPSLEFQVDMVLDERPDAALIFIGANDVTHRIRPSVAVGHLAVAVRRLLARNVAIIVGTCPDLGTILPTQPPLRWIARRWSRQLAAAQTIAVVESGGRTVSLTDLLGPEFIARAGELLSHDRYHPSAAGYARAVEAILPSLAAALGVGEGPEPVPQPERGEGVRSLPDAAVEAAAAAGTEVTPTAVGGRERGPWGRWAELRHRIRVRVGQAEPPAVPLRDANPLLAALPDADALGATPSPVVPALATGDHDPLAPAVSATAVLGTDPRGATPSTGAPATATLDADPLVMPGEEPRPPGETT